MKIFVLTVGWSEGKVKCNGGRVRGIICGNFAAVSCKITYRELLWKNDYHHDGVVEDIEFISSLHGEELVFFSGLSCTSEEWLKRYITELDRHHVGGLIMSFRGEETYSREIIDYCNEIHFPVFSASWTTPYIDIMRLFAEILLKNEQRETNLIAAFKNAIYYPENEGSYLSHFERNGFLRDMEYVVVILSCHAYDAETGNERLCKIEKSMRFNLENMIAYEESGRLIILAAGCPLGKVLEEFRKVCRKDSNVYVGIGTLADGIRDIHRSHENAYTAYCLTKTAIPRNLLSYDELGIYKTIIDRKSGSAGMPRPPFRGIF